MRISSSAIYDTNVNQLNTQQGKMLHTQQQLASGRRMLTPADDPFASGRVLEISQADAANGQFVINRNAARHSTAMAETILQSVTTLLQDVRTSAVGDGSGALSQSDKMSLAEDLRGRFEELLGLANSTDGAGNYLFSGFQGRTQPFVKGPGGITYVGDDGQRLVQVEATRRLATSDSGADVFMRVKNGNGKFSVSSSAYNKGTGITSQGVVGNASLLTGHEYKLKFESKLIDGENVKTYDLIDMSTKQVLSEDNAFVDGELISFDGVTLNITGEPEDADEFYVSPSENESAFKSISDLIVALKSGNPAGGDAAEAHYTNSLNRALNNIDNSLNNVSTIRASLGSRLRELDSLDETGSDLDLQYKTKMSELQDLDFNKSVSDLNQQQTSLTAAQKSFKQVSDLSLFNYV